MAVVVGFPSAGRCQKIALFRLTDIEGFVSLRSFLEGDTNRRDSGTAEVKSRQRQRDFEEEVQLLTHNYIYHPNFLKLDLGGGVVFAQKRFESDTRERTSADILYDATGRLTILEKKPYPLTLFYERRTSPASAGLAERFFLTDTRYGFNFSFLEPVAPATLNIDGLRQTQKGKSSSQIMDESFIQLNVGLNKAFAEDGGGAFLTYQFERHDSAGGSPDIPIEETRTTTHSGTFSTTYLFGSHKQAQLRYLFSFFTQLEFPERRDIQNFLSFDWDITDSLTWFSNFNLRMNRVEEERNVSRAATVGLGHQLYESLHTEVSFHTDDSTGTSLDNRASGVGGSVAYRKKTFFGDLSLHYRARYDINDRRSSATEIQVFGERVVLTGLLPVELENDNVIASTVVVFNETRTRTFTEGIDYQLTVVGVKTRIERLLGGAIQDGETVLVDYSFATTGTFKFSFFDQNYGARVNILSYLFLFARFRDASQTLLSGTPLQPLNSVYSQLYGAQFQLPIGDFAFGGEVEYEDHKETISSFRRMSYAWFIQVPFAASTAFLTSFSRVQVDNLGSPEDVDAVGVRLRLDSRPWPKARFSAEFAIDKDTGGTLPREIRTGILLGEWRFRRLILLLEGRLDWERQGDVKRNRTKVSIEIRREF
jgi:hypothetical protein